MGSLGPKSRSSLFNSKDIHLSNRITLPPHGVVFTLLNDLRKEKELFFVDKKAKSRIGVRE